MSFTPTQLLIKRIRCGQVPNLACLCVEPDAFNYALKMYRLYGKAGLAKIVAFVCACTPAVPPPHHVPPPPNKKDEPPPPPPKEEECCPYPWEIPVEGEAA